MTQINTLIYNAITTLQNEIINNVTTIGTSIMQAGLSVIGTLAITGNLTVSGDVTMPNYLFCAGYIGAPGTKITSTGRVSYTVARTSGYATGVWTITFASAHPLGANYIVNFSAQGGNSWISPGSGAPPSTSFKCATYQMATTTLIDIPFYFMVLAS